MVGASEGSEELEIAVAYPSVSPAGMVIVLGTERYEDVELSEITVLVLEAWFSVISSVVDPPDEIVFCVGAIPFGPVPPSLRPETAVPNKAKIEARRSGVRSGFCTYIQTKRPYGLDAVFYAICPRINTHKRVVFHRLPRYTFHCS